MGIVLSFSRSNFESIDQGRRTSGFPLMNQGPPSQASRLSASSKNLKRRNPLAEFNAARTVFNSSSTSLRAVDSLFTSLTSLFSSLWVDFLVPSRINCRDTVQYRQDSLALHNSTFVDVPSPPGKVYLSSRSRHKKSMESENLRLPRGHNRSSYE